MKRIFLLFIFLISLSIMQCSDQESGLNPSIEEEQSEWGYSGEHDPSHWYEIDSSYAPCAKGHKQSPINITEESEMKKHFIKFDYHKSHEDIINNGHTIQFKYDDGSCINFDQAKYQLKQFHFHTPSEHHIEGRSFPAEIHFVHKDSANNLLVVSVLIEKGEKNEVFDFFLNDIPFEKTEIEYNKEIDIRKLIPDNQHFYHYIGSLTTPPCTEGVKWLIFKKHINASEEQINKIQGIEGKNARPIQKSYNRRVEGF